MQKRPWFIDDIWRWSNNPHKWTVVPRVRHKVLKSKLFNYYKPGKKITRQLLLNKSNRDKFFGFPIIESSVDGRKNPLVHVKAAIIVFHCVDSLIADT